MDFSNRGSQQSPAAPRPGNTLPGGEHTPAGKGGSKPSASNKKAKWIRIGASAMLIALAVLALAVVGTLVISNTVKGESGLVDSSKYQAVFLTNDQVYFGRVSDLNSKYLVLNSIYYLRTQGTDAAAQQTANNVSLVKLGCELHKPFDKMVINKDQVQFWENLQDDGQVATAIKQYQQQNPKNTCSNTTTGGASSSSVQGTATTPATTKP
jgi:hypothetical protein